MLSQKILHTIQTYILLATGAPSSNALRDGIVDYLRSVDFTQVNDLLDAYMETQVRGNEKSVTGVVQVIANNGFGLNLSDQEAQQLVADLNAQGIDSWSELFVYATTALDEKFSTTLDNRSEAANRFTDLLAEQNKDSDYAGPQAKQAAQEWIAGIGASEESLVAANAVTLDLIDSFNEGNVQGRAFDGYIAGATVFIDENGDSKQSPGEVSTITDALGNFQFDGAVPSGKLVVKGGTDISTNQPFTSTLSAPLGSATLSPLSALANQLLQRGQAENIVAAEDILFHSLGIPRVDLSYFDPIKVGLDPTAGIEAHNAALQLHAATAQISNLLLVGSELIREVEGATGNTMQSMTRALLGRMIEAEENGETIDLSDTQVLTGIIQTGVENSNITSNTDVPVGHVATVLSEINTITQAAAENNSNTNMQTALSNIVKLQTIVQSQLIPEAVEALKADELSIIVDEFMGDELIDRVDEEPTGALNETTPVNDGDELTNNPDNPPTPLPADTIAPTLSSSTPADDATTVAADSNIVLTFSETVIASAGNIVISDGSDTRTIAVTDGTQVSFSSNSVTINPTIDLNLNTTYNVQMANEVIEDDSGNAFAGISDTTTLNFSTTDTLNPTLIGSTPTDDATTVAVDNNIVLTFSETVIAGTDNIVISDGTDTRTIAVTDGTQVKFSGNSVSVNPTADLNVDTIYNVQMVSGVITDATGNAYTGINDNTTLNIDTTVQLELSAIEQNNNNGGFVINGVSPEDHSGISVSSAGDVNGDGLADLIVGTVGDDPNGTQSGASSVIFGQTNGTVVELSDIEGGTGGFIINGASNDDRSGRSVSSAGDVNGDGFADLIVGAYRDDPNGSNSGASFVVFGKTNGTVIELSDLNAGNGGFVINGVSAGDRSGRSVSSAGDVNGDGFADLIVGARYDDPNGTRSGASFVIFGKNNGTTVELSDIDAGNGGFDINGVNSGDESGLSVNSAGDVNGDGLTDLIIGARFGNSNGSASGTSFVVFGKTSGTTVELSNIDTGNGGFVINGASGNDQSGYSVSNAGDVNGDGFADLIVGAWSDDPNGSASGASFVVFGKNNGTTVELSDIDAGNGGFDINGVNSGDESGLSVNSAGDVNGDGLTDLIIGARFGNSNGSASGTSFVVFGKTSGTTVELSNIDTGNGGFVINGASGNDQSGYSVSNAGDVNGDGFADLIVGAWSDDPNGSASGASFVVFGKANGIVIELSDIEAGNGGFVINGVSADDRSGFSVSSVGDVNGDGLADLIMGAPRDDPNGSNSGASFVVFGKANGTTVELSDIEAGTGGFVINGISADDQSGRSVSDAGDVNGDGFADLIVGAYNDDSNSINSGASFVVFGGQGSSATVGTSSNDTLTGNGSANQLVAGTGDDTLVGNDGADVLRGGAGDDILAVSDLTFASLDGGTGTDTLRFDAVLNLDLRALSDSTLDSIEIIDLTNDSGNSTLSLNITDVLNLNEAQTAANTLFIDGSAGDTINLDNNSNGQTGSWSHAGSSVYEFSVGGVGIIGTVTVDEVVSVNILV